MQSTTTNDDDNTYTQLMVNNVQANNLIKILLDKVNELEWQLLAKDNAYKATEEKLHDIERAYDTMQEEFWTLKNNSSSNSQPPPLPKVDISKASLPKEF